MAVMCGLVIAASAAAQTSTFDIPEGDLKIALEAYARQSGVRLVYLSEDVRDRRTSGARGDMSQDAALNRLLAGTGLTVKRDQSGALAIVREAANAPAPSTRSTPSSSLGQAGSDTYASTVSGGADASTTSTTAPTTFDAVQVTGSHIKRAQMSGVGPTTVIDAETIQSSGAVSVETLLQRLPASAGAAGSQSNNFWTGNGNGTTQINLRGLGVNRTLVLLNGRRVVNGGTGANNSVDLNVVPLAWLIASDPEGRRIGDLRRRCRGRCGEHHHAQGNGWRGAIHPLWSDFQGDGEIGSFNLAFGTIGERSSMSGALTYAESGTITMASRAPCPLGVVAGTLQCVGNSSTIGGRARLADGRVVNFNQDPNGDPRSYELYDPAKHNYNYNLLLNAVSPIKRVGLSGFGQFDLTENTRLFTELMATNRQSNQRASPNTLGCIAPSGSPPPIPPIPPART